MLPHFLMRLTPGLLSLSPKLFNSWQFQYLYRQSFLNPGISVLRILSSNDLALLQSLISYPSLDSLIANNSTLLHYIRVIHNPLLSLPLTFPALPPITLPQHSFNSLQPPTNWFYPLFTIPHPLDVLGSLFTKLKSYNQLLWSFPLMYLWIPTTLFLILWQNTALTKSNLPIYSTSSLMWLNKIKAKHNYGDSSYFNHNHKSTIVLEYDQQSYFLFIIPSYHHTIQFPLSLLGYILILSHDLASHITNKTDSGKRTS